jgi:predicted deacylase
VNAGAGAVARRTLRFDSPALRELEWPCFEATGASDGPRLCIIAGIHGCEYSSIAAVVRLMRELDPAGLTGSVVAVPIVNLTSFRTRTPFVSPDDGKNLNRCFPGDPEGTYSDQLAHHVATKLIGPADALIDMHGGDMVEALAPFTLYDDSAAGETARAMAIAYGLPFVVCTERVGAAVSGTTSATAADAGIPGITPEVGGCGLLEEEAVAAHVRGARNAMRVLGMLAGDVEPAPAPQRSAARFVWLRCRDAGWWQPSVRVGEDVPKGGRLGAVLDPFGEELEAIEAPEAGVPLFITSSPAVTADGLLLGLGAGLAPLA